MRKNLPVGIVIRYLGKLPCQESLIGTNDGNNQTNISKEKRFLQYL